MCGVSECYCVTGVARGHSDPYCLFVKIMRAFSKRVNNMGFSSSMCYLDDVLISASTFDEYMSVATNIHPLVVRDLVLTEIMANLNGTLI